MFKDIQGSRLTFFGSQFCLDFHFFEASVYFFVSSVTGDSVSATLCAA